MEIRPLRLKDLAAVEEIDAVIESTDYLHVERAGQGMGLSLTVEKRPLRQKLLGSNPLSDELAIAYKLVVGGNDEGVAVGVEHEEQLLAASIAQPRSEFGTYHLVDLRVDHDFRRQGLATALMFQIMAAAREAECRALSAEVLSNQFPANQMLQKLGFVLAGVDTQRRSNHDLVKESATLFWYAAFD